MESSIFSILFKELGETWAIALGVIVLCMHFYFRIKAQNIEETSHKDEERNIELERLSKQIYFLVEENRKLRTEISELRDTYLKLHEKYLEVLSKSSE